MILEDILLVYRTISHHILGIIFSIPNGGKNHTTLVGGFSPPLWKMMEFVSWDDYSIPNCMEK